MNKKFPLMKLDNFLLPPHGMLFCIDRILDVEMKLNMLIFFVQLSSAFDKHTLFYQLASFILLLLIMWRKMFFHWLWKSSFHKGTQLQDTMILVLTVPIVHSLFIWHSFFVCLLHLERVFFWLPSQRIHWCFYESFHYTIASC